MIFFTLVINFITNINIKNKDHISTSKILINFFHFLLLIDTYNINISKKYQEFFNILNKISGIFNFWFSLDCLIAEKFEKKINFYHWQFLGQIIILLFFIIIYFLIEKKFNKAKIKRKFSKKLIVLLFILQPIIANQVLSNVICINIDGKSFYIKDTDSICYGNIYFIWVIFFYSPLIILFSIYFPFYIF